MIKNNKKENKKIKSIKINGIVKIKPSENKFMDQANQNKHKKKQ